MNQIPLEINADAASKKRPSKEQAIKNIELMRKVVLGNQKECEDPELTIIYERAKVRNRQLILGLKKSVFYR
jgi:hypothetical protein